MHIKIVNNIKVINDYKTRNNEMCIELFNKYYLSYYESALYTLLPKKILSLQTIKCIIKTIFFRNVDKRNILLLHNIRIDSHRFVVQRALSLLSE